MAPRFSEEKRSKMNIFFEFKKMILKKLVLKIESIKVSPLVHRS